MIRIAENNTPAPAAGEAVDFPLRDADDALRRRRSGELDQRYRCEAERLRTFCNWPADFVDIKLLAMTGMFYTGRADQTQCYFCRKVLNNWQPGDDPIREHLRHSPHCPLLCGCRTSNVPIDAQLLASKLPRQVYDVCGSEQDEPAMEPRPLDLAHAEYALEEERRKTFVHWPKYMRQKPLQLSEAGFFYTGVGDRVKCFSCGQGLKDWEEEDDPWEQHAFWSPRCPYVRLLKGEEFVAGALRKCETPPLDSGSMQQDCLTPSAAAAPPAPADVPPSSPTSEQKLCKICFAREYETTFLPCGHVVACAKCAVCVKACPMCRRPLTDIKRLYFC